MTTIVIHDGVIAWDSQLTNGTSKQKYATEKVQMTRGRLFAMAGDPGQCLRVVRWICRGAKTEDFPKFKVPRKDWDFEIIEISKSGMRVFDEDHLSPTPVRAPYFLGSGSDFARGAIELGTVLKMKVHALDALQAATEADIYTDYPLKAIDIAKSLELGQPVRRRRRRRA